MRNGVQFLPAAALLLGCAFLVRTHEQAAIPLRFPLDTAVAGLDSGYHVGKQKLSDEERRVAGMDSYDARVYWRDSTVAFTTFVSYYKRQSQGSTIHSPRNCLPGAGWEVLRAGTTTVDVGGRSAEINRYMLKNGASVAVAYYWYQGRGRVVANEYRVKWDLLKDATLLGHTEESLARIIVPVTVPQGADSVATERAYSAAYAVADRIAQRMIPQLARALPDGASPRSARKA